MGRQGVMKADFPSPSCFGADLHWVVTAGGSRRAGRVHIPEIPCWKRNPDHWLDGNPVQMECLRLDREWSQECSQDQKEKAGVGQKRRWVRLESLHEMCRHFPSRKSAMMC